MNPPPYLLGVVVLEPDEHGGVLLRNAVLRLLGDVQLGGGRGLVQVPELFGGWRAGGGGVRRVDRSKPVWGGWKGVTADGHTGARSAAIPTAQ